MSIEELNPEHRLVAERSRFRIMALIANGVVRKVVTIEQEPEYEDDQVS